MTTTRRTFLIATGSLPWMPFGGAMRPSTRTWVVDEGLPQSRVLVRRAHLTGARIASLSGDAGWLWIERLSSSQAIGGITRFADAFVLSQLGADNGMRATRHRAFDNGAVLWTIERC
ncbi:hypothetical protein AWB76_03136 [Caballeronia temeraria]|uniref:Uncharacterized protein n=1 Tax=Caballeronia temeraria TaxID=1777137 RepID=A0A158AWR5_9BURK|nr:hypothetical protein [Caballeronia temeraria]SAK61896.1 hypothetical protein AWB76_03136 [Caballeronia temeraria]